MTDEKKQQYTLRISGANKTGLIVILYDMLSDYVEEAMEAGHALTEGNAPLQGHEENRAQAKEVLHAALRHARGCIRELAESLDFQYSPSIELFSLYRYMDRQLAGAQRKESIESLKVLPYVIRELREAAYEVAKKDTSPALMENAQTVYAGLTYGKNDLNVSFADQGHNRGFRV